MEIPEGRPGKKFETKQEIGNKKVPQAPGKIKWETLRNAASWQVPAPVAAIIHQMLHTTVFVSEFNRRLYPFDPFIHI